MTQVISYFIIVTRLWSTKRKSYLSMFSFAFAILNISYMCLDYAFLNYSGSQEKLSRDLISAFQPIREEREKVNSGKHERVKYAKITRMTRTFSIEQKEMLFYPFLFLWSHIFSLIFIFFKMLLCFWKCFDFSSSIYFYSFES